MPPRVKHSKATVDRRQQLCTDALAYIKEHCWPDPWTPGEAGHLRIEQVAEALETSTRHLQRVLREDGGTTFRKALAAARMARAEQVLLSTLEPVTEIARRAGYKHPGQFAKVFREERRAAPARLRQRRLGRRARRIGGVRGSARWENRPSDEMIRRREGHLRERMTWLSERFEEERAGGHTQASVFGHTWARVYAGYLVSNAGQLRKELDDLDRAAWREKGTAGRKRRAALRDEIDELTERLQAWATAAREQAESIPPLPPPLPPSSHDYDDLFDY